MQCGERLIVPGCRAKAAATIELEEPADDPPHYSQPCEYGTAEVGQDAEPQSIVPANTGDPASTQRTYCKCGQPVFPDAAFCHRCGTHIAAPMPRYRLICKGKGIARRVIELDKSQMTVGKSQHCDLAIPNDDYVSRDHARIVQREGNFFIEDLGSSNGTLLSIQRPTPLQDGDEILVGTHVLRFERVS